MNEIGIIKPKEELEEFLKNLGIEYRFGCYERKDPEACLLLGEYVDVYENNLKKANKIYKKTCDAYQMGRGCHSYANSCFFGRFVEKNYNLALDYYSKGCLYGYGASCFNAGKLLNGNNEKVRKEIDLNNKKAKFMFKKGCFFENPDSCFESSILNYHAKEFKNMIEQAEKGCKLNNLSSCYWLKNIYTKGIGIEKDLEKANKINEKCTLLNNQYKIKNPYSQTYRL